MNHSKETNAGQVGSDKHLQTSLNGIERKARYKLKCGSRDIQLKSPVREIRTLGSVPGAMGDHRLYGDYDRWRKTNDSVRVVFEIEKIKVSNA